MVEAKLSKSESYRELISKAKALVGSEENKVANLSNLSALLYADLNVFWVGFYLVEGNELVLGPFQGPVACTRIAKGKGVCGTAWEEKRPIVVDDVDEFPGHIACSALSKSEIVVPIIKEKKVIGVLDIDSDQKAFFNEADNVFLTQLCDWISNLL